MTDKTRRQFLQEATLAGAAALAVARLDTVATTAAALQQPSVSPWRSRMGLELYTVRDLMANDFEGTLAKVAALGYSEVEPATNYNNMSPRDFRAMLDKYKLSMPSTHVAARGQGADLEKSLEGFQIMGIKYTEVQAGAPAGGRGPGPAPTAPARGTAPPAGGAAAPQGRPANLPPGAYYDAGTGIVHNSFVETEAFGPYQPAVSLDSVKRRAEQLNANGKIAHKFGIKMLVHNHTGEFEKLTDSPKTTYDVLLEDTDPALVTMQLDIGWAYMAGVDPLALFKAHPGRFELWHIKDVFGLKTVKPGLSPNARVSSMAIAPVGSGQIDWRPVFAQAELAGLKHFVVEQDNAAAWGDSMAAAQVSFTALAAVLENK